MLVPMCWRPSPVYSPRRMSPAALGPTRRARIRDAALARSSGPTASARPPLARDGDPQAKGGRGGGDPQAKGGPAAGAS